MKLKYIIKIEQNFSYGNNDFYYKYDKSQVQSNDY